ncbi:MAG: phosphoribosylformylglycinamidine synthase, partial [Rikenellaceae bacterium]
MILLFKNESVVYATQVRSTLSSEDVDKLKWLYGNAEIINAESVKGFFIGPRREMITPWSTNAVEITQNMGISGIERIEEFIPVPTKAVEYDKMLYRFYDGIGQDVYNITAKVEPIIYIEDIRAYNKEQGLALNEQEVIYLEGIAKKVGRRLTDSEVFGFSQVNSEHCRHKIFNGKFIIDGVEKETSLFGLIKNTTKANHNGVVSAYKDNCAFLKGPVVEQFAPASHDKPDFFKVTDFESVISIKAETHNFPTTVEPFNGAATGAGGEIRDRMAGGKGSFPIAGTAVY